MHIPPLLAGLFLFVLFSAMKPAERYPNANSWSVYLDDEKHVLTTPKTQMGDVLFLSQKQLAKSRELVASRYLCGHDGGPAAITLKDEKENILKAYSLTTDPNNRMSFAAKIPVADLQKNEQLKAGKQVLLYFTIQDAVSHLDETVLLARLALKK